jgi:hypothetical protein
MFACGAAPEQTPDAGAKQPASYYVSNGNALQPLTGDPAATNYSVWQVWLFSRSVPRSVRGLKYVRWGVLEATSARAVIEQLETYQDFERAYKSFFGPDSWGPFTFSYSAGPIAIADASGQPAASDLLESHIDSLNQQLGAVANELRPSLVNGSRSDAPSAIQADLQDVRNSMEDVARFYDKLSKLPAQRGYLAAELAILTPGANRAIRAAPQVIASLPSVKLPRDSSWMSYSESGGKEGTIAVRVTEVGSSAWVQQAWSGGDGSMTGTNVITIVPFQDIGPVNVRISPVGARWTVSIESASSNGFPQTIKSPLRTTAARTYPEVDANSNAHSVYLEFTDPQQAQDAYAYFLFHKQRGN